MADPNAALLTLFTDMLTQLNETRAEAAAARAELQVHIQAQAAAPTAGARATASAAIMTSTTQANLLTSPHVLGVQPTLRCRPLWQ